MKMITLRSKNGKHTVIYGDIERVFNTLSEALEQVFIYHIERKGK